jgi:ABC-type dipeptide/oligopeptide/nickel transport system permease component
MEVPMFWCGAYLTVALLFAVTIFAAGNWLRTEDVAAPDHPGTTSAVAGMLWPVVIVGIAELALLNVLSRGSRYPELQLAPLAS